MTGDGGPQVVAVGGGHGLAASIRAVRGYAAGVTAVVSTADDGGSTGRLRSGMKVPAVGDLRRCLVAMADAGDRPLGEAFEYRFAGTDVEGHALGNLVLAALDAVTGDFLAAVDEVARLLGLDPEVARVLPATVEPVELHGRTVAGDEVGGQVAVAHHGEIEDVWLEPDGVVPPAGVPQAIGEADQVVLGPGDLYTSVLAAAVVDGLREALAMTRARRVYVCNLRADNPESRGYDVGRHLAALAAHGVEVDVAVVDEDCPLPLGSLGSEGRTEVVRADVARPHGLAHDSDKLGRVLASLLPSSLRP